VAYTRGFLDETDWHNLRPGIRPLPQDALNGHGVQAEGILSYAVTPAFNVGIGGRYWYIQGDGFTRFDQTAGGGSPQHTKFWTERYGGFAQASYRFGDPANMPVAPVRYTKAPPMVYAYSWTGLHFGVNAGYGFSDSDTTFAPLSINANLAINVVGDTPTNQHTQNAGFLGGGQIGYDWQFGRVVAGIETDLDWANISGTIAQTSAPNAFTTTTDHDISSLGTVRARLGKLATDSLLVYATGGLAYGNTRLSVDQRQSGFVCLFSLVCANGSASGVALGWVGGVGFEYAADQHFSFKGEALYVDLGSRSVNTNDTGGLAFGGFPFNYAAATDFNAIITRFGVNYKL
jgi:outer membrane immunogenic protein